MSQNEIRNIIEVALLATEDPLNVERLQALFAKGDLKPDAPTIRAALAELQQGSTERGVELVEVASGFRYQVRADYAPWVARLWAERPARYSPALLETLSLIAYRQPVTRGEIEDVRGVSVSSSIVRTLMEREWIRVLGHKEVPGRPALYGTTRKFLDDFGLQRLEQLPALADTRDLDALHADLFSEQERALANAQKEAE